MAKAGSVEGDGTLFRAENQRTTLAVLALLFFGALEELAAALPDEIGDFTAEEAGIGLVDGDIAEFAVFDIGRGIQISDPAASQLQKFPG
jgi:hypothetical protein